MKREKIFCGLLFAWLHIETYVSMLTSVLAYVPTNITVFWNAMPWSLVDNCHSTNPTYSYAFYHRCHKVWILIKTLNKPLTPPPPPLLLPRGWMLHIFPKYDNVAPQLPASRIELHT
jgi:hypothetical protein